MAQNGGRFDFDDGGSYSGGWLDGKAHGYGVCTGPKGQGEYAGAWVRGFEESGVYTWPSGNTFSGEWQDGKRHGVGVEIKGHWVYRGEWSQGYKGRYGIRQSTISCARYEGTWTTSFQDGYGVETYVDEGTYQGQWQRGMRHGFGVRHSAPFGIAAQYRDKEHLHASLPSSINSHATSTTTTMTMEQHQRGRSESSDAAVTDRHRGGFVLTGRSTPGFSDAEQMRSRSSSSGRSFADRFRLRRGQSTGDLPRSVHHSMGRTSAEAPSPGRGGGSAGGGAGGRTGNLGGSGDTGHGLLGSNVDIADADCTETYMGEWKADKRSGFGVSERSDGLKYVGEWYNDKKYGYGVTTLKDGTREEGKYKDNELITSGKKRKLFAISKTRLRDRVDAAIVSASRAAEVAQQKAVIASARRANARQKAESSDKAAIKSLSDADVARDEADKYLQQTPQTAIVPVNQETRARMLPGLEEQRSGQQQRRHLHDNQQLLSSQHGKTGEAETSMIGKTSRLLPPRQESSDSYTSNQSSSVGSSSVTTTSPPPPKPPRSSPATFDGRDPEDDPQYGRGPPQGRTQPVPSRPEPPVVTRMTAPLYARGPANVPRNGQQQQDHLLANHNRRSSDDRGYADDGGHSSTTLTAGGMTSTADRRSNSVRNFRPSPQTESSAYLDFSDSADSGHQASSSSSRAPRGAAGGGGGGGGGPTSPQILLHPATPIGRQGSQRAQPPQDDKLRQRFPSAEGTVSFNRSNSTSNDSNRTFSPVLSNRQYQQPISHDALTHQNSDPSRGGVGEGGRDFIDHQFPNSHDDHGGPVSATRHQPDNYPRHLPQPTSPNARIPTAQSHPSNFRSPSSAAPSSSTRNLSSDSFRMHQADNSRNRVGGGGVGVRSGTSSPNTWDRVSHRRRGTLPNIVHYPPPNILSKPGSKDGSGGSGEDPRRAARETFIIENGVRRRLITDPSGWDTAPSSATEREPPLLLQRFTLESTEQPRGGLEKRGIKASLPDVYRVREATTSMPREQVFALSQHRRDELRKEREDRERETVIIRLSDITSWCKENQLIVFLVALNLSLAAMFLSFLTHSKDTPR